MSLPSAILKYLFSTSPSRLQVSTPASPASGRIDVSVSSGGTDIYCSQIEIAVPIGADPTDFSENTPMVAVNTTDWTTSGPLLRTGIELGLTTQQQFAHFTFQARDPSVYKIDYNLVFSLIGPVNTKVGTFGYIVRETSRTDPNSLTVKQSMFGLDKVLPSFYLENLVATTVASPLVPATEFANGTAIRLAWESNGTWFQVYEKGNATPIYSGSAKTSTVSGGVATDTTYFLQASMTGDPGNDGGGFGPIYLYDSLTVTISNPDLTPKSVAVSGGLSVGGATSLNDTTVNGALSAGGATLAGAVTVGSQANPADMTVSRDILARNGTPLKQQLVHKRPLYGIGGQAAIQYNSTLVHLLNVYGPFTYTVPPLQNGATRRFRLYAIYTDNMTAPGASTIVLFQPWDNNTSPNTATFHLPYTYGLFQAYRDGYSEWINGTPMPGHAQVSIQVSTPSSAGNTGMLAYLEIEAWDFFG